MKKWIVSASLLLLCLQPAVADEGMWLVQKLDGIYSRMKSKGLKVKESAIYNEQIPGLADAVVAVDGGSGSGSMISDQGLMITNHHVAYSDICALSTPENNYLETGFWARTRADEIPVKEKTVWSLRKVVDVTDEANALVAEMKAEGRWGAMSMRRLTTDMEARYSKDTDCTVLFNSMWGGKRYLVYFYDVYKDIRLVGTPPVSIGAFGGDYDNWGWPQHKGDFTLYRVYTAPDGSPAEYSASNVPLKPRKVLSIATCGVADKDFAMVLGFPGRTHRYSSSFAVEEKEHVKNPIVVANRKERMEIIKRHMERDARVRMAYSDAYFGLSNYADYAKWETSCLRRFGVSDLRRAEEQALQQWIEADPARKAEYGSLLADLKRGYQARRDAERNNNYFRETWLGPSEGLLTAHRVVSYLNKLDRMKCDTLHIDRKESRGALSSGKRLLRDYDEATDRDLLAKMTTNFTANVAREFWGDGLAKMYDAAGGDADRMVREACVNSFCTSAERFAAFFTTDRSVADIRRDPVVVLVESVNSQRFKEDVNRAEKSVNSDVYALESLYASALYDFRVAQQLPQYPNANSTMRLTYGTVGALNPSDGVHYDARSTIAGYMEKYNPGQYEYRVDERMRKLIVEKDWGRWGEKGDMYVNFLTNNDITGGNSGSPVLDGRGRLIGLAFDGNRESMAGDIWFHPELAKTVCVDIRYVMWVIEKYAGAEWLIDELKFEK